MARLASALIEEPEYSGARDATAVFRFDGTRWETDGRALFNVTPAEAIHLYRRKLEMVACEMAPRI